MSVSDGLAEAVYQRHECGSRAEKAAERQLIVGEFLACDENVRNPEPANRSLLQ